MSKMDQALKAKWVEALRSGKYKQGRLFFEKGNEFCCLGVLCKAAGQPAEISDRRDNWEFVESVLPLLAPGRFAILNDDDGKSFAEIADYIEANL